METDPAGIKTVAWETALDMVNIDDLMVSDDRNSDVGSSTNKGNGMEKGKGKMKGKTVEEGGEGMVESFKFVIPMLPTQGVKSKLAT